jgi:hypothetical protein
MKVGPARVRALETGRSGYDVGALLADKGGGSGGDKGGAAASGSG